MSNVHVPDDRYCSILLVLLFSVIIAKKSHGCGTDTPQHIIERVAGPCIFDFASSPRRLTTPLPFYVVAQSVWVLAKLVHGCSPASAKASKI